MDRWIARVVAVFVVIGCMFGGAIVGAIVGNLIVPARLDWSAESGPGLMLVGAFVGLCAGFAFGLWAAMRIVDEARQERAMPADAAGPSPPTRVVLTELPPPPASSPSPPRDDG
jgi:F0F1-type ATP synthase assembly protein I